MDPVTRTELDAKLDALRADTRASVVELRSEMREGFAKLGEKFAEDRAAHVKWIVGVAAGMVAILGTWTTYTAKQAPAAQPPAPIVIYPQQPVATTAAPAPKNGLDVLMAPAASSQPATR